MSENTNGTPTTTTAAPAPAAKKPVKANKAKAPKGKATVRQRVFALLAKRPSTGPEVQQRLELSGIPSFLKDEAVGARPRIRRERKEGVRGIVYSLTAAGRKALADGTVDENAAERAVGEGLLAKMR